MRSVRQPPANRGVAALPVGGPRGQIRADQSGTRRPKMFYSPLSSFSRSTISCVLHVGWAALQVGPPAWLGPHPSRAAAPPMGPLVGAVLTYVVDLSQGKE